ncbi:Hypothetical predicted protein [Olea europaea subsp. europaea]|uniref:Uncharacterized protein n=1 Tax=Olea europaea subsp. europaea TaxID=158383 RepID=A0A8S0RTL7_OLEEU|nr:Hypothetical predicted protein [Olea europaea subsp. europaea]
MTVAQTRKMLQLRCSSGRRRSGAPAPAGEDNELVCTSGKNDGRSNTKNALAPVLFRSEKKWSSLVLILMVNREVVQQLISPLQLWGFHFGK